MELPGSGYLYTITTVSITYAGFAALIIIFRQIIGGGVSNYDVYLVRNVLLRSFIVAVCSIVPPLLGLFDLSQSTIWRASSLIAALVQVSYVLTVPARRRAVTDIPVPKWALVTYVLQLLIVAFFLIIALGMFVKPAAGPFAAGVTAFLLMSFFAYSAQLGTMLRGPLDQEKHN